ncbi:MAG: hypothetical protein ACOX3D_12145 [Syntrophomonadales bacterium]
MYKKWREMYKSKLVTADEAAAMIRDGEVISSAFGNGQPIGLYEALRKRVMAGKLYKPTILAASMVQDLPLMDPELRGSRLNSTRSLSRVRESRIKEGYFTHTPNRFSDLEKISSRGLRSVQVSVLRVSPMDSHGFFSTGINVDFGWDVARSNPNRRLLMVEVNKLHAPGLTAATTCISRKLTRSLNMTCPSLKKRKRPT